MQIDRLFGIVYLLLEGKQTTAQVLANHFAVSKRTILRDLDTLTLAGIPIYTNKGKGGGISILEHFVLNKATLSEDEQSQIILALQSISSTQNIDTHPILVKLSALFNKIESSWIEVDFTRWGHTQTDKEKFETLKGAILGKLPLSFSYYRVHGDQSQATVLPLKLVFKSKSWYVQGYALNRNDYRTYKINRMHQIQVLNEPFDSKGLSALPIEHQLVPSPDLISLKLLFTPDAAYRIFDEFDISDVEKNADGSFTVCTHLPHDPWLQGFLLSFGASLKVLEPQWVRQDLLNQLKKIEASYLR